MNQYRRPDYFRCIIHCLSKIFFNKKYLSWVQSTLPGKLLFIFFAFQITIELLSFDNINNFGKWKVILRCRFHWWNTTRTSSIFRKSHLTHYEICVHLGKGPLCPCISCCYCIRFLIPNSFSMKVFIFIPGSTENIEETPLLLFLPLFILSKALHFPNILSSIE